MATHDPARKPIKTPDTSDRKPRRYGAPTVVLAVLVVVSVVAALLLAFDPRL